jgi:hypothetical protein
MARELDSRASVDGSRRSRLDYRRPGSYPSVPREPFLYSPIELYAVNKAVQFEAPVTGWALVFAETSVTDRHWSVRPWIRTP